MKERLRSIRHCSAVQCSAVQCSAVQVTCLEGPVGLILLILRGPQQLDLDVQLPVWLEVDPDLVERLLGLADQVGEGELCVCDEVIGGNGGTEEATL
jgi:hypothetical protein